MQVRLGSAAINEVSHDGQTPEAETEDELVVHMDDGDELTGRLMSLPNILCHAANGDVFLVGCG